MLVYDLEFFFTFLIRLNLYRKFNYYQNHLHGIIQQLRIHRKEILILEDCPNRLQTL